MRPEEIRRVNWTAKRRKKYILRSCLCQQGFRAFSEDIYRYSGQARSRVETQKIQQVRHHSNHTWELYSHSIILVRLLLNKHSSRPGRVYKEEQTEVATEHMEVIYKHRETSGFLVFNRHGLKILLCQDQPKNGNRSGDTYHQGSHDNCTTGRLLCWHLPYTLLVS